MTVRSKQDYLDSINVLLADNSTQQISPQDVRTGLIDLADSVHRMLENVDVTALNMSTPDTTTTRMGVGSLEKLSQTGRTSEDNSAFGYFALRQNYNGTSNTAIGATALSCNLYGDHNVGVGHNALAGNVTGSGNVGIGNFTGQSNKSGSFNISIGHGAGNYIGQNDSYKFYLGAHAVDYTDICDSTTASGLMPLLFGDLENNHLGVGVNTLHNFGAVQVSGDVSPSENAVFNLGHGSMNWNQAYITSGIAYPDSGNFTISRHSPKGGGFPDQYDHTAVIVLTSGGNIGIGTSTPSGNQGLVTVGGSIIPSVDSIYRVGTPGLRFDGFFNDLHVSGNATINDITYNTLSESVYENMSIHMAVSGTGDPLSSGFVNNALYGYLPDGSLNGGGFFLHSQGVDYQRDYQFIFNESDQSIPKCSLEVDNVWSRSHWKSNISLKVDDGLHVQTQRILGDSKLSMVTQTGCQGVFLRTDATTSGNHIYFGSEDHVDTYSTKKNVNFYAPSGGGDYFVGIHTVDSGVTLGIDFATTVDTTPSGFSLEYVNRIAGDDTFVIKRNASSKDILTVMESGFVGISNKDSVAVIPQAHLHVQGNTTAEARVSSNGANSSILRVNRQDTSNGVAINYQGSENMIDFVAESGNALGGIDKMAFMTIAANTNYVTIGEIYNPTNVRPWRGIAPLTVYHRGEHVSGGGSGTLALAEQEKAPTASAGFGKICVKPKVETGRTQTLIFVDDGGNEFDLTRGTDSDGTDSDGTHTVATNSLSIGSGALASVTSSTNTIAIGVDALENAVSPDNNVVIGTFAANSGTDMQGGIVIGPNNLKDSTSTPTNILVIGTGLYYNTTIPDNTLAIGHGATPLLTGNFSTRSFKVADGDFSVSSANDTTITSIDHEVLGSVYNAVLDIKDTVNAASTSGTFRIDFTDASNSSSTVATFDHRADAMTNSPTYYSGGRPFLQVEGDVNVRGAVQFADGSYFDSATGVIAYAGTGIKRRVVSYGSLLDMDIRSLPTATADQVTLSTTNMVIANSNNIHRKISLSTLGAFINSGSAYVGDNCNHIFIETPSDIKATLNSSSIFIGCDAGFAATGWKHSVFIGTDAGKNATTPNAGLTTDTASTFIGYGAGKNADNVSNAIFIGTNAGTEAKNAQGSIFIGQSAGRDMQAVDCIGIGPDALRGSVGNAIAGTGNIEIVTNMLNGQRLMYQHGNLSNRLNIQNTIAGHMGNRTVSVGDAVLTPDAPLSARMDHTIPGHSGTNIQTWYCDDVKVAQVTCSGHFESINYPQTVEGFVLDDIIAPSGFGFPESGTLRIRNDDFYSTSDFDLIIRDSTLTIPKGSYVIATRVNKEYKPIWVSCSGGIG